MKPIRFIHTADLHVGSPFKGISRLEPDLAPILMESTFDAFDNVVRLALDKQVDFVVIAGDLVDGEDRNLRSLLHLQRGFSRLDQAGIPVFVVLGNHDPLGEFDQLVKFPANTLIFPSSPGSWHTFKTNGGATVSVFGISYKSRAEARNLVRMIPSGPGQGFRVAIVHSSVGTNPDHQPYAPCSITDLVNGPADYWALGHIHTRKVISKRPPAIYPGNIQGRSFKEVGARGCYLVEVDSQKEVDFKFIETDVVRWVLISLDISGLSDMASLRDKAIEAIAQQQESIHPRAMVCRLSLTGRAAIAKDLISKDNLDDLLADIRITLQGLDQARVILEGIQNLSRPPIDIGQRKQSKDLIAYVLSEAEALLHSEQGQEEMAQALSELFKNKRVKRFLQPPAREELEEILDRARFLLMDLLEDGNR